MRVVVGDGRRRVDWGTRAFANRRTCLGRSPLRHKASRSRNVIPRLWGRGSCKTLLGGAYGRGGAALDWSGARSSLTLSLMIRLCFHDPPKSSRSVSDDGGGGAVHVVMLLKHMIRIRILEIRKGRRVSRPEGLASDGPPQRAQNVV